MQRQETTKGVYNVKSWKAFENIQLLLSTSGWRLTQIAKPTHVAERRENWHRITVHCWENMENSAQPADYGSWIPKNRKTVISTNLKKTKYAMHFGLAECLQQHLQAYWQMF